ncbi:hypothetical protein, partial [Aquaspirillum serpens]|uniref:hypothetical protein n=1 Tax=Aquaspirillum serpens TaxID=190 RepID=UPI001B7F96BF
MQTLLRTLIEARFSRCRGHKSGAHTTELVVFQLGLDYLFCKFTLQNPDANAASTTPGALFLTRGSLMKP